MNLEQYTEAKNAAVEEFIKETPIVGWDSIDPIYMPIIKLLLGDIYRKGTKDGMHEGLEIARQYGVGNDRTKSF